MNAPDNTGVGPSLMPATVDMDALIRAEHRDPFSILGPHGDGANGQIIRAYLPNALSVDYLRVAVSRKSPLANRMPDIDEQLKRMVDTGEIDRLLNESEVTYRDMINLPENPK